MNTVEPIKKISDLRKLENNLSLNNKRDFLIFKLGINSGLRISDILALDVKDVRNKAYISIKEKKTGKYKKIPINNKLKRLIKDFIQYRKLDEPLFKTKFNNRLERTQCYRILQNAGLEAGLECKIGTHSLRKTFGYHHYKKFKDVVILQKIFNHSSPVITLRYIGIEQDEIEKSYNNFAL